MFLNTQHSELHSMDQTYSYTIKFNLNLIGIQRSHKIPEILLQFSQPAIILFLMSSFYLLTLNNRPYVSEMEEFEVSVFFLLLLYNK